MVYGMDYRSARLPQSELGGHASRVLALSRTAISLLILYILLLSYTQATGRTNTLVDTIIALDRRSSYIRLLPLPIIWLGEKGKLLRAFRKNW